MIRIRPVLVCGTRASLLAWAESSKVETVQQDRPANFQLVDDSIDFPKATHKFADLSTIGDDPFFLKGYSEVSYATLAGWQPTRGHTFLPLCG